MDRRKTLTRLAVAGLAGWFAVPAGAAASAPVSQKDVFTRAVVRSITAEPGQPIYVRLKLVPRAKIPFSTLTYRVLDDRLVTGLREGDNVAFRARRIDGENVVTDIHVASPCERNSDCKSVHE